MTAADILTALAAHFPPEVVSWRIGSTNQDKTKGMALAFIDARDVMNRFDEACGPFGWQNEHVVPGDGKKVTCRIGVRNPETGEWIWKTDGAGETDVEGEKGSYSDSLKRAAVLWKVGRYLYDLDSPWVEIEPAGRSWKIKASEKPKLLRLLGGQAPSPQRQPPAKTAPAKPVKWPIPKGAKPYKVPKNDGIEDKFLRAQDWGEHFLAGLKSSLHQGIAYEWIDLNATTLTALRQAFPELGKEIAAAEAEFMKTIPANEMAAA